MKQKGFSIVIVIVILALVGIGFAYYLGTQKGLSTNTSNINMPILMSPSPISINTQICSHPGLGISFVIPKSWECKNIGDEKYTLNLKSDTFTATVSSLGRGTYCTPPDRNPSSPRYDPDSPDSICEISTFYKNSFATWELYKSEGKNKEILAIIPNIGYMSITWKNMENNNLTESQKQELINVLESTKNLK